CTASPGDPDGSGSPQQTGSTSTPSDGASGDGTDDGAAGQDAAPTLNVRSSGGAWVVRGTGYTGRNQYLVQCTGGTEPGARALDECDMSTSEQAVADDDGRISATRQPR